MLHTKDMIFFNLRQLQRARFSRGWTNLDMQGGLPFPPALQSLASFVEEGAIIWAPRGTSPFNFFPQCLSLPYKGLGGMATIYK
jgi:hypothetical protein